jgi:hypothetical protein
VAHRTHLLPVLVIGLLVGAALPARAQIFAGRDTNGTLILSDRRIVDGTTLQRVDRPASVSTPASGLRRRPVPPAIDALVDEHASAQGVRPELVHAVIQVESAYNPRARSIKGAMGLMQLMPATASDLGVRNPYDPTQNIRGGITYLRQLLDRYNDDEELALAAYNAGPGAVDRYGQTVPPYRETQDYVQKIRHRTKSSRSTTLVYEVTEVVDGLARVSYTNRKPDQGPYRVVGRSR